MTPIQLLINRHPTQAAAAKSLGTNRMQLIRWRKAGALVDSDGWVWIRSKVRLNVKGENHE